MNNFDNQFNRNRDLINKRMASMETFQKFFWVMWVFAAFLGLGVVGVGIWAVIRLVLKYG